MFTTSTQRRHWMFKNEDDIRILRNENHQKFMESQRKKRSQGGDIQNDEYFLSPEDCEQLLSFFEYKLMEFCSSFQPPMPKVVKGTAFQYFKRFYLNNSVMDCHPKEILVTAAYLACKVEEFNVSINQFIANIQGNKERATDIILNNELLLMKELNFHLTVHNPFRPIEGFLVDIKTRCVNLSNPESLRSDIEKFLDDVNFTNACLTYAPSQIALASIIHAASKNGQNMDSYVLDVLFGSNDEKLRTFVESIKNIRLMVKNIEPCPLLTIIKPISEKLEKCRNQENNPDSQVYKRKLKEMLDEDDVYHASKQIRMDDGNIDGITPNA
ncbi:cyclin-H [Lepeophtheirus salmonis]|uniref:cyclin-H n=1 Tax=Lepeophtheirus salmonis TaxID=72036 RepID=UPI001AEA4BA9|nr:cyclin-H-like [Lepeophtheirus salmonis]